MISSQRIPNFLLVIVTIGFALNICFLQVQNTDDCKNNNYHSDAPDPIPMTRATVCPKVDGSKLQIYRKSQSEEDLELLHFFNGMCGGTYIEMGALDGIRYSNSFMFNMAPGLGTWQGVMVELSPDSFKLLKKNRPNDLALVHAAVCQTNQTLHIVKGRRAISGVWEFASPEFRQKWWADVQVEDLPTVSCSPLKHILDQHVTTQNQKVFDGNVYYFDFFSLDVEGAEWTVLQSIDWEHTAFGILFLEADGSNIEQERTIIAFLQKQGYIYLGSNKRSNWFRHKDFDKIYKAHLTE